MNSHSTTRCLKLSPNFKSPKNVGSLSVVEFKFELRHIPNTEPSGVDSTHITGKYVTVNCCTIDRFYTYDIVPLDCCCGPSSANFMFYHIVVNHVMKQMFVFYLVQYRDLLCLSVEMY